MKALVECRLYTFVDTAYVPRGREAEVARMLCDGGSDLIQLRAKDLGPEQILRLAELLIEITRRAGAGLVINDHPDIAVRIGAPYFHLGQEDFFDGGRSPREAVAAIDRGPVATGPAKRLGAEISVSAPPRLCVSFPLSDGQARSAAAGPDCQVQPQMGLSSHAPWQAERAIAAGASYLGVGPVYATGTKPGVPPVGLEYVRWAAKNVAIPWFAIGGVTLERVPALLDAGARRICVVSEILRAPDIPRACQRFRESIVKAAL